MSHVLQVFIIKPPSFTVLVVKAFTCIHTVLVHEGQHAIYWLVLFPLIDLLDLYDVQS